MEERTNTTTGEGPLEFQRLDALSNDALDLFRLIAFIAAVYTSVAAFALEADAFHDHLIHSGYTIVGAFFLITGAVVAVWSYLKARRSYMTPVSEYDTISSVKTKDIAAYTMFAAAITLIGSYLLILGLLDTVIHGDVPLLFSGGVLLVAAAILGVVKGFVRIWRHGRRWRG